MDDEKVEKFLEELATLTEKYRIAIGGCGCCGSPWLYNLDESLVSVQNPKANFIKDRLEFYRDTNIYKAFNIGEEIDYFDDIELYFDMNEADNNNLK